MIIPLRHLHLSSSAANNSLVRASSDRKTRDCEASEGNTSLCPTRGWAKVQKTRIYLSLARLALPDSQALPRKRHPGQGIPGWAQSPAPKSYPTVVQGTSGDVGRLGDEDRGDGTGERRGVLFSLCSSRSIKRFSLSSRPAKRPRVEDLLRFLNL
ncbi:hypothetical protein EAI_14569 [Harpegnathos saltator]|uniref:Uncharacterized protein n=1 Tax=Harpegnathos saltator TaxID=610380 RepID=E2C745_HARSA|nr:hypothetical protein EAI_14569 [Harpegnathos saltator]